MRRSKHNFGELLLWLSPSTIRVLAIKLRFLGKGSMDLYSLRQFAEPEISFKVMNNGAGDSIENIESNTHLRSTVAWQTCPGTWQDLRSFIFSLLKLTKELPSCCQLPLSTSTHATVIFCFSAGCGRTGVICAIDYTRMLLKDGVSFPASTSKFPTARISLLSEHLHNSSCFMEWIICKSTLFYD